MANEVKRPRFWIDSINYANAVGYLHELQNPDLHFLNMQRGAEISSVEGWAHSYNLFKMKKWGYAYTLVGGVNYVMVLGHDFASSHRSPKLIFNYNVSRIDDQAGYNPIDTHTLLDTDATLKLHNCDVVESLGYQPEMSGISIVHCDEMENGVPATLFSNMDHTETGQANSLMGQWMFVDADNTINWTTRLGGVSQGWTFTMPHNADVSQSFNLEMDGYDVTHTKGGATLTNIRHTGYPKVGAVNSSPFDMHGWGALNQKDHYIGRRSWDIKFSYIDNNFINTNNTNTAEYDFHGGDAGLVWSSSDTDFSDSISGDQMTSWKNDFYNRVWRGTLGGALPFIFQPDISDYGDWAIARFDQNSFKFNQVAPKLWEVSMKIVESW